VQILQRIAESQSASEIKTLEDVAPLLLRHSMYKSYPLSILDRGQFDRLTKWLQTLTNVDLSNVDATGVQTIDDWLDLLDQTTDMRLFHSSGTTGKLSFTPRTRLEQRTLTQAFIRYCEGFHEEPYEDGIGDVADFALVLMGYRHAGMGPARIVQAFVDVVHGGDDTMVYAANSGRLSADVLSLAGRLAAAEAKGERGRLALSPILLERRDQFVRDQAEAPTRLRDFFERVSSELRGRRIWLFANPGPTFDVANEAVSAGLESVFAPDSLYFISGGLKGRTLPDGWQTTISRFLGTAYPRDGFGMSEGISGARKCVKGSHYHPFPTCIPYLLDPSSGALLPRYGTQTGRFGFYDLAIQQTWGGILSGDEVTITWDDPCRCGRAGPYFHQSIRRYSDSEGGDDKVTCAGAQDAHDAALDFIIKAAG
jgi:hypothetical protein